jgi:hypothetical protein
LIAGVLSRSAEWILQRDSNQANYKGLLILKEKVRLLCGFFLIIIFFDLIWARGEAVTTGARLKASFKEESDELPWHTAGWRKVALAYS